MIKTIGIKKVFKRKKGGISTLITALDGINLEIQSGCLYGLLGVNGAGKTTMIKILSTLLEPTEGTAEINGFDIKNNSHKIRPIINVISGGERQVYWRLTPLENLKYFAAMYNVPAIVAKKRIENLIELVGLETMINVRVEQLSQGMKQRLQIARGLINDPSYLFLDEPTIGLDITIAKEIRNLIKGLSETYNKTIILTTHYLYEAEELCDKIGVINNGKIIMEGSPNDIKRKCVTKDFVRIRTKNGPEIHQIVNNMAKNRVEINIINDGIDCFEFDIKTELGKSREAIEDLAKSGIAIMSLEQHEPSLEDAVFNLIS